MGTNHGGVNFGRQSPPIGGQFSTLNNRLKHLVEAGADVAGSVLTRVDVKRHAQYDYADSGSYYLGSYRKYYSD